MTDGETRAVSLFRFDKRRSAEYTLPRILIVR